MRQEVWGNGEKWKGRMRARGSRLEKGVRSADVAEGEALAVGLEDAAFQE